MLEAVDRAIALDLEVRAERDTFRLNLLTPREREVCALVAAGRLNKQIAGKLGVYREDDQSPPETRDAETPGSIACGPSEDRRPSPLGYAK